MDADSLPCEFGDYFLLERIARGGMAEVYRAAAFGVEGFARTIAVKRILDVWASDENFVKMFVDEARISVQLGGRNIVQIYELGEVENQYYIAMEYIAGKDLRRLLKELGRRDEYLPIPAVAFIMSSVCNGLDQAHRKTSLDGKPLNIVHRDVTPHNILLGYDGSVKVTDFGVARAEDRISKTRPGTLKGKSAYMAPEYIRGEAVDLRADIFTLGALLYEALTGHALFRADSDYNVMQAVVNGEISSARESRKDVPEELDAVIRKCCQQSVADRYQSASEIEEDLQPFLIEGKSIYKGAKLATLMERLYADDIANERHRLSELLDKLRPKQAGGDSDNPYDGDEADLPGTVIHRRRSSRRIVVAPVEQWDGVITDNELRVEATVTASTPHPTPPLEPSRASPTAVPPSEVRIGSLGAAFEEGPTEENEIEPTLVAPIPGPDPAPPRPADLGPTEPMPPPKGLTPSKASAPWARRLRANAPVLIIFTLAVLVVGAAIWVGVRRIRNARNAGKSLVSGVTTISPGPDPVDEDASGELLPEDAQENTEEDEGEDRVEPPPEPVPTSTLESEDAGTEVEKKRDEVTSLYRKNGIIFGDVPTLDVQRKRLAVMARKGEFERAITLGNKLVGDLEDFSFSAEFIRDKSQRLEKLVSEADEVTQVEVQDKLEECQKLAAGGDLKRANRVLNAGFRAARRRDR